MMLSGLVSFLLESASVPADQVMPFMPWLERIGGWGVVLLIVRWMMLRLDAQLEQLKKAVDSFMAFEESETKAHTALEGLLHAETEIHKEQTELLRKLLRESKRSA